MLRHTRRNFSTFQLFNWRKPNLSTFQPLNFSTGESLTQRHEGTEGRRTPVRRFEMTGGTGGCRAGHAGPWMCCLRPRHFSTLQLKIPCPESVSMVSFVPRFTQTSGKFRSGPRPATKIFMTSFLPTAILRSAGAPAERRARIGKRCYGGGISMADFAA